jgi:hypothetical protein
MLTYWAVIGLEFNTMMCLGNYSTQENDVKATGKKYAKYMLTNNKKQIYLRSK